MSERDAHDGGDTTGRSSAAASIDSFSQLPFIRPAASPREKQKQPPPPLRSTGTSSGIRLFGVNVPPDAASPADVEEDSSVNESTAAAEPAAGAVGATGSTDSGGGGGSQKFECHYCCRNFSTSQALGGHQNAQKRERQHANPRVAMRADLIKLRKRKSPPAPCPQLSSFSGRHGRHPTCAASTASSLPLALALPPPEQVTGNPAGGMRKGPREGGRRRRGNFSGAGEKLFSRGVGCVHLRRANMRAAA